MRRESRDAPEDLPKESRCEVALGELQAEAGGSLEAPAWSNPLPLTEHRTPAQDCPRRRGEEPPMAPDKSLELLTDAILQRDQPRTADLFFRMVKREGRSLS